MDYLEEFAHLLVVSAWIELFKQLSNPVTLFGSLLYIYDFLIVVRCFMRIILHGLFLQDLFFSSRWVVMASRVHEESQLSLSRFHLILKCLDVILDEAYLLFD